MQKICALAAAFLSCAVFSFAQAKPSQITQTLNDTAANINTLWTGRADSVSWFKSNMKSEVPQAKPKAGLLNEIDPAIRNAFMEFYNDTDADHDKPYYLILANYLSKISRDNNIILNGKVSFTDGKDFLQNYAGYKCYDYYKKGFSSTAEFHKIDHILNVGVANHVRLMMNLDGKPLLSVSFIQHVSEGRDFIYVHSWQVIDSGEKKGLYSTNITPDGDDAAYKALYKKLQDAGADIDTYGPTYHSAG